MEHRREPMGGEVDSDDQVVDSDWTNNNEIADLSNQSPDSNFNDPFVDHLTLKVRSLLSNWEEGEPQMNMPLTVKQPITSQRNQSVTSQGNRSITLQGNQSITLQGNQSNFAPSTDSRQHFDFGAMSHPNARALNKGAAGTQVMGEITKPNPVTIRNPSSKGSILGFKQKISLIPGSSQKQTEDYLSPSQSQSSNNPQLPLILVNENGQRNLGFEASSATNVDTCLSYDDFSTTLQGLKDRIRRNRQPEPSGKNKMPHQKSYIFGARSRDSEANPDPAPSSTHLDARHESLENEAERSWSEITVKAESFLQPFNVFGRGGLPEEDSLTRDRPAGVHLRPSSRASPNLMDPAVNYSLIDARIVVGSNINSDNAPTNISALPANRDGDSRFNASVPSGNALPVDFNSRPKGSMDRRPRKENNPPLNLIDFNAAPISSGMTVVPNVSLNQGDSLIFALESGLVNNDANGLPVNFITAPRDGNSRSASVVGCSASSRASMDDWRINLFDPRHNPLRGDPESNYPLNYSPNDLTNYSPEGFDPMERETPPLSASSMASSRRLEWDNGADIGYSIAILNPNFRGTIPEMARSDPEGISLMNESMNVVPSPFPYFSFRSGASSLNIPVESQDAGSQASSAVGGDEGEDSRDSSVDLLDGSSSQGSLSRTDSKKSVIYNSVRDVRKSKSLSSKNGSPRLQQPPFQNLSCPNLTDLRNSLGRHDWTRENLSKSEEQVGTGKKMKTFLFPGLTAQRTTHIPQRKEKSCKLGQHLSTVVKGVYDRGDLLVEIQGEDNLQNVPHVCTTCKAPFSMAGGDPIPTNLSHSLSQNDVDEGVFPEEVVPDDSHINAMVEWVNDEQNFDAFSSDYPRPILVVSNNVSKGKGGDLPQIVGSFFENNSHSEVKPHIRWYPFTPTPTAQDIKDVSTQTAMSFVAQQSRDAPAQSAFQQQTSSPEDTTVELHPESLAEATREDPGHRDISGISDPESPAVLQFSNQNSGWILPYPDYSVSSPRTSTAPREDGDDRNISGISDPQSSGTRSTHQSHVRIPTPDSVSISTVPNRAGLGGHRGISGMANTESETRSANRNSAGGSPHQDFSTLSSKTTNLERGTYSVIQNNSRSPQTELSTRFSNLELATNSINQGSAGYSCPEYSSRTLNLESGFLSPEITFQENIDDRVSNPQDMETFQTCRSCHTDLNIAPESSLSRDEHNQSGRPPLDAEYLSSTDNNSTLCLQPLDRSASGRLPSAGYSSPGALLINGRVPRGERKLGVGQCQMAPNAVQRNSTVDPDGDQPRNASLPQSALLQFPASRINATPHQNAPAEKPNIVRNAANALNHPNTSIQQNSKYGGNSSSDFQQNFVQMAINALNTFQDSRTREEIPGGDATQIQVAGTTHPQTNLTEIPGRNAAQIVARSINPQTHLTSISGQNTTQIQNKNRNRTSDLQNDLTPIPGRNATRMETTRDSFHFQNNPTSKFSSSSSQNGNLLDFLSQNRPFSDSKYAEQREGIPKSLSDPLVSGRDRDSSSSEEDGGNLVTFRSHAYDDAMVDLQTGDGLRPEVAYLEDRSTSAERLDSSHAQNRSLDKNVLDCTGDSEHSGGLRNERLEDIYGGNRGVTPFAERFGFENRHSTQTTERYDLDHDRSFNRNVSPSLQANKAVHVQKGSEHSFVSGGQIKQSTSITDNSANFNSVGIQVSSGSERCSFCHRNRNSHLNHCPDKDRFKVILGRALEKGLPVRKGASFCVSSKVCFCCCNKTLQEAFNFHRAETVERIEARQKDVEAKAGRNFFLNLATPDAAHQQTTKTRLKPASAKLTTANRPQSNKENIEKSKRNYSAQSSNNSKQKSRLRNLNKYNRVMSKIYSQRLKSEILRGKVNFSRHEILMNS